MKMVLKCLKMNGLIGLGMITLPIHCRCCYQLNKWTVIEMNHFN